MDRSECAAHDQGIDCFAARPPIVAAPPTNGLEPEINVKRASWIIICGDFQENSLAATTPCVVERRLEQEARHAASPKANLDSTRKHLALVGYQAAEHETDDT